jgi:hypothetical protein
MIGKATVHGWGVARVPRLGAYPTSLSLPTSTMRVPDCYLIVFQLPNAFGNDGNTGDVARLKL